MWGGTREINKKSTSRLFETGCIHVWDSVNKKLKKTFKLSPPPQLPGLLTMPVPLAMVYHSNHVWVASDPIILCFDPYVRPHFGLREQLHRPRRMLITDGRLLVVVDAVAPPQTQVCKGYLDFKGEVKTMITVGKEIWSGSTNTLIKVWNPQEVRVSPLKRFVACRYARVLTVALCVATRRGAAIAWLRSRATTARWSTFVQTARACGAADGTNRSSCGTCRYVHSPPPPHNPSISLSGRWLRVN